MEVGNGGLCFGSCMDRVEIVLEYWYSSIILE